MLDDWTAKVPPARLANAEQLLSQIDVPAVAAVTAQPEWGANVLLYRAIIAVKRQQFDRAEGLMAQLRPAFAGPTADPYSTKQIKKLDEVLQKRMKAPTRL